MISALDEAGFASAFVGAGSWGGDGGSWASKDPNTLGGSSNTPASSVSGVSLQPNLSWSNIAYGPDVALKSSGASAAYQAVVKAPVAAPAVVRATAPAAPEGLSPVVIGAAVVGLGVIGAIIYKLRKR